MTYFVIRLKIIYNIVIKNIPKIRIGMTFSVTVDGKERFYTGLYGFNVSISRLNQSYHNRRYTRTWKIPLCCNSVLILSIVSTKKGFIRETKVIGVSYFDILICLFRQSKVTRSIVSCAIE